MSQSRGDGRSIEEVANIAALPFRMLEERGVPCGYERSFKMGEKKLLANRYMLGVDTAELTREHLTEICRRLGMPKVYLKDFREQLPEANLVFLGFEHDGSACRYKIYLEFWEKLKAALVNSTPPYPPALLHLGYKWDVFNDARRSVSRYLCHPKITVDEIFARIRLLYENHVDDSCYAIVEQIITHAAKRCGHRDMIYLEADEENNPRNSFDVNLYPASLPLDHLSKALNGMQSHFELCPDEFRRLRKLIVGKQLGHLSGGLDRNGDDFLTVYYEM